jgi:hypothetical protein
VEKSAWVGLVFCGVEKGGEDSNGTWVCHHPDNCGSEEDCKRGKWGEKVLKLEGTKCEDLDSEEEAEFVAFSEGSTLRDVVVLPVSSEVADWWKMNEDRTRTMTSASSVPGVTVTTTAVATSTPSSKPDHEAESRKKRGVGLSVGLAIGIPAVLGLALMLCSFAWKMHKKDKKKIEDLRAEMAEIEDGVAVLPGAPT